jgi:hypothetical protein
MPAGGCWCGSRAEAAHQGCNQARQSCRKLCDCAGRVSVAHVREQRRLSREQENPEVRKGVGIANQSGPIGFFLESTTSSSSYPSPIVRARPQHVEEAREPSYRASLDPFARTSLLWQSRLSSPRITTETTPSAIFHPRQPFPANFFVTHGTSSPSSTSHRRSCSPRKFTFRQFSSTTKSTSRFALTH